MTTNYQKKTEHDTKMMCSYQQIPNNQTKTKKKKAKWPQKETQMVKKRPDLGALHKVKKGWRAITLFVPTGLFSPLVAVETTTIKNVLWQQT